MIYTNIEELLSYALSNKLIDKEDEICARNGLLELLGLPDNVKVYISKDPSPITEVYSVVKDKSNNYIVVYGKGEQDRYNSINENRDKYSNVDIVDAGQIGDISATKLREAIKTRNKLAIKSLIPEGIKVDDFLMNFQIHEDKIPGGLAQGKTIPDIAKHHKERPSTILLQLAKGIEVEMEHTTSKKVAKEKGFNYVLDSTTGSGVLVAEGTDLLADVKKSLGF
jgi:hypothetical protein